MWLDSMVDNTLGSKVGKSLAADWLTVAEGVQQGLAKSKGLDI